MLVFFCIYFKIKILFINIFFIQKYIIIAFILYDLFSFFKGNSPASWIEFYDNKESRIFTWYSGIVFFKKESIFIFIFFLVLSKLILIFQIIIGFDLCVLRIFIKKLKFVDNFIYISFIIIPWIYINIIIVNIIFLKFKSKELTIFLKNWIFINLWLTGKVVVNNTLIFTNEWINWKKHSFRPHFDFFSFLKLCQKYKFNTLVHTYSDEFTY
jgi:hypothetical protein